MIRIDIFDNLENAKTVFRAYYEMIHTCLPFDKGDIAKAVNDRFKKEYDDDLGISEINDSGNNSNGSAAYLEYIKKLPELYRFLYNDNKINIGNLGMLLCGRMTEKDLETLRKNCKNSEENKALTNDSDDNSKKTVKNKNAHKDKYKTDLKNNVFCYESMSRKQDRVYKFVSSLKVQVCPYCNRNYISVFKEDEQDDNEKEFKTRPDLDHFYNKMTYPYLAVSMRNLVPSCRVCNSAKHNKDVNILYPYTEGIEDKYRFTIRTDTDISYLTNKGKNDFHIELVENRKCAGDIDFEFKKRVKTSSKVFGWEHLYNFSKNYALRVLQNGYIFNRTYRESIVNAMPDIFGSEEEVKRIINPKLCPEGEDNEEPLSKLTRDIYRITVMDETDIPFG